MMINVVQFLWSNSENIRNLLQSFQAFVTILGLFAAVYWFLKRRQINPRAKLTHSITHQALNNETFLIRATATLENVGNVLIEIDYVKVKLKWLSPITNYVSDSIERCQQEQQLYIDFPQIEEKERNYKKHERITIEPRESENIYFDFILEKDNFPESVTTIMIYCYIRNRAYRDRPLGWSFQEIHDLSTNPD